mmetsp:Transcript_27442/g.40292  ORF Transcript_27442/g.40292 Transcript_27442/m.40292 type:complete len:80 (+) Transcript_27442:1085-1324(+)
MWCPRKSQDRGQMENHVPSAFISGVTDVAVKHVDAFARFAQIVRHTMIPTFDNIAAFFNCISYSRTYFSLLCLTPRKDG